MWAVWFQRLYTWIIWLKELKTQCDVEFRFVAVEANFSFVQNERLKNVNGCLPTLVLFSVLSCH